MATTATLEYNTSSQYRIVINKDGTIHRGEWAGSTSIAFLSTGKIQYVAFSEFFAGSLPTNKVFQLSLLPTAVKAGVKTASNG